MHFFRCSVEWKNVVIIVIASVTWKNNGPNVGLSGAAYGHALLHLPFQLIRSSNSL